MPDTSILRPLIETLAAQTESASITPTSLANVLREVASLLDEAASASSLDANTQAIAALQTSVAAAQTTATQALEAKTLSLDEADALTFLETASMILPRRYVLTVNERPCGHLFFFLGHVNGAAYQILLTNVSAAQANADHFVSAEWQTHLLFRHRSRSGTWSDWDELHDPQTATLFAAANAYTDQKTAPLADEFAGLEGKVNSLLGDVRNLQGDATYHLCRAIPLCPKDINQQAIAQRQFYIQKNPPRAGGFLLLRRHNRGAKVKRPQSFPETVRVRFLGSGWGGSIEDGTVVDYPVFRAIGFRNAAVLDSFYPDRNAPWVLQAKADAILQRLNASEGQEKGLLDVAMIDVDQGGCLVCHWAADGVLEVQRMTAKVANQFPTLRFYSPTARQRRYRTQTHHYTS